MEEDPAHSVATPPTISATDLGFSYDRPVLQNFNLWAHGGSITLLLGQNGAGKSTALHLLSGERRPGEGRVRVLGQDPYKGVRQALSYFVKEWPEVPIYLTPIEAIRFHAQLFDRRRSRSELLEVLERLGLRDHKKKRIKTLSKGLTRRAELACLLAADPKVWLLDEPQTGLDPEGMQLLGALLKEARDRGRTVVMATHTLSDVQELADQVIALKDGRIIFSGNTEELLQDATVCDVVLRGRPEAIFRAVRALKESEEVEVQGPKLSMEEVRRRLFEEQDS